MPGWFTVGVGTWLRFVCMWRRGWRAETVITPLVFHVGCTGEDRYWKRGHQIGGWRGDCLNAMTEPTELVSFKGDLLKKIWESHGRQSRSPVGSQEMDSCQALSVPLSPWRHVVFCFSLLLSELVVFSDKLSLWGSWLLLSLHRGLRGVWVAMALTLTWIHSISYSSRALQFLLQCLQWSWHEDILYLWVTK